MDPIDIKSFTTWHPIRILKHSLRIDRLTKWCRSIFPSLKFDLLFFRTLFSYSSRKKTNMECNLMYSSIISMENFPLIPSFAFYSASGLISWNAKNVIVQPVLDLKLKYVTFLSFPGKMVQMPNSKNVTTVLIMQIWSNEEDPNKWHSSVCRTWSGQLFRPQCHPIWRILRQRKGQKCSPRPISIRILEARTHNPYEWKTNFKLFC